MQKCRTAGMQICKNSELLWHARPLQTLKSVILACLATPNAAHDYGDTVVQVAEIMIPVRLAKITTDYMYVMFAYISYIYMCFILLFSCFARCMFYDIYLHILYHDTQALSNTTSTSYHTQPTWPLSLQGRKPHRQNM